MKRASYKNGIDFIAHNDNAGDGDDTETIAGYATVFLVSELFGVSREKVAADVMKLREVAYPSITHVHPKQLPRSSS